MDILQTIWEAAEPYLTMANGLEVVVWIIGIVIAKTGLDFIGEIKDIVETYRDAKRPSSPGGTDVTDEELNKIRAEAAEAVEAVWDRYSSTIFGFLGRLYNKIAFWK